MSKGSKFAVGAILGAATGIVAGVLTAPKSGKETRDDIKRKAVELKDQAFDTADDVRANAEAKARELEAAARDIRETAEKKARELQEEVKRANREK